MKTDQDLNEASEKLAINPASLKRDVVLHIGRHKSGTSTLQRTLHENTNCLALQGINYPRGCRNGIAHHEVAKFFIARYRRDARTFADSIEKMQNLQHELAANDATVMLSSEAFQGCPPSQLRNFFSPSRVSVVVYIREQLDYALSAYSQAVHARKMTSSLSEFIRNEFHPDYDKFLDRWANEFGANTFHVRVFDRTELHDGDIVGDFFKVCGLDISGIQYDGRDQNPSIGGHLLDFKRAINRLDIPADRLHNACYKLLSQLAAKRESFRQKPDLPADEAKAYRDSFQQTNKDVARRYFDRETLFKEKPIKSSPSQQSPVEDSFREILAWLRSETNGELYWLVKRHLTGAAAGRDENLAIIKKQF